MDTHTEDNGLAVGGSRRGAVVSISETISGYHIDKGRTARKRAVLGELAAITGCLFFGAAAFGQWLIPQAPSNADIFMFQVSGTIMFFVFSALLYLIARRGLTVQAQVDTKRENFRLVRRNREGGTTVLAEHGFADIGSVYIKRSKSDFIGNQMFVQPLSAASPILIASGPARELEPLLDRIQRDFRGQLATAPKVTPRSVKSATRARARSAFATG